jgi:hypothetical protein
MQEMDGSSWKRQGSSIVWSPDLLAPLVIEGDAIPLRTVVAWLTSGSPCENSQCSTPRRDTPSSADS